MGTSLKSALKRWSPDALWNLASRVYWYWRNRGRHRVAAVTSPRWVSSKREMRGYADRHSGERCFVLGNGPSLRKTDLSKLRGEITFGANRIYLLFDELGFATTYYVAINTLVIEQCALEIAALSVPKFVTWRARQWLSRDPQAIFLDTDYTGRASFATDLTERVFEGGTVTFVSLQLAYYMGFNEVVLVGVDHSYATPGPPNKTVTSAGADPNHFDAGYFGKGFRWQLPDLGASERAYRLAKTAFERDERTILDATVGGKLNIFPKVEFETLFNE